MAHPYELAAGRTKEKDARRAPSAGARPVSWCSLGSAQLRRHTLFGPTGRIRVQDARRFVPVLLFREPRPLLCVGADAWIRPGERVRVRRFGNLGVVLESVHLAGQPGQWGPECCLSLVASTTADRDAFVLAMHAPAVWGARPACAPPSQRALAGPVVTAWPWCRDGLLPLSVSDAETEERQNGTVVVQGELVGVGAVVVKMLPEPRGHDFASPTSHRELRVLRLATRAAERTGLPHVAEYVASLCMASPAPRAFALFGETAEPPPEPGQQQQEQEQPRSKSRSKAELSRYRVATVLRRVGAPCANVSCVLDLLDSHGASPERARAVVRSVLAQYAAACVVLGDYGIAQVDNHPGNLLLEWADGDWAYDLLHPVATARVPVCGFLLRIIDWDLGLCVPFPTEEEEEASGRAECGSHGGGELADFDAKCRAGAETARGVCTPRWNPGEDWVRFGLMLRDPAWFPAALWRDHVDLPNGLAQRVFGTFAEPRLAAHADPDANALPGASATEYHFLVQGRELMGDAAPVYIPGARMPGEGLLALLEDADACFPGFRDFPVRRVVRSLATDRGWTRERALLGGPGRRFNVREAA